MPVLRKRNHWHGLALECLRRTRTRFSALCYAVCCLVHHRHNKPLFRGLSVATLWRVDSTLSTFASLCLYNSTHIARKTCKVSNKKGGAIAPACVSSFILRLFLFPFFYERPFLTALYSLYSISAAKTQSMSA